MSGSNPWDRQPHETDKAWDAFVAYRNLGPGARSFATVGRQFGKTGRNYEDMSVRYNWTERTRAYDADQDRIGQEAQREALIEMRKRQTQLGKLLQALGGTIARKLLEKEQTRKAKGTPLKPRDAATLVDVGVKLERLNAGEATERVDTNISGAIAPADLTEVMRDREFRKALDTAATRTGYVASESGGDGGASDETEVDAGETP